MFPRLTGLNKPITDQAKESETEGVNKTTHFEQTVAHH